MSFSTPFFIVLFCIKAIGFSAYASQSNVALFRIEENVYWSNQIAPIIKNIKLLDCVFGESALLEIFPKDTALTNITNCSLRSCPINLWSKHHKELLYVISVLKAVELLKRRGGPFMTRAEQEKLLLPNAKVCKLPPFSNWSNVLVEFINAELTYQDILTNGLNSTKVDEQTSKEISFKRDIESLTHTLFYVPEH